MIQLASGEGGVVVVMAVVVGVVGWWGWWGWPRVARPHLADDLVELVAAEHRRGQRVERHERRGDVIGPGAHRGRPPLLGVADRLAVGVGDVHVRRARLVRGGERA